MKNFNKILVLLLVAILMLTLVACASTNDDFKDDSYKPARPGELMDSGTGIKPDDFIGPASPNPGTMTASAWNDNEYYDMWLELFKQAELDSEPGVGKFFKYTTGKNWGFNSLKRIKVCVTSAGSPVAGATVMAYDAEDKHLFTAISDAQGNAYLFVTEDEGKVTVASNEGAAETQFTKDNRELSVELDSCAEKLNIIEIMFVVDVTGSMGDELNFLKTELADVITRIAVENNGIAIKLAFLFYRDIWDDTPFKYSDFLDVTDPANMALKQADLNEQYASGGGDYEEAVDEALMRAVNKQWSTGNTTKIIFHVLDAPAHGEQKYIEKFNSAVVKAAEKGIRICPILCSGAAEVTEYSMRQAAIYTGGTFIFVTDDSGVGGAHHDPEIPNATVEPLNLLLVRIVNGYHTGDFKAPTVEEETIPDTDAGNSK